MPNRTTFFRPSSEDNNVREHSVTRPQCDTVARKKKKKKKRKRKRKEEEEREREREREKKERIGTLKGE